MTPGDTAGTDMEAVEGLMPKRRSHDFAGFGERLARLRKAAGFTQEELANEIGVSRRMIAYYERETQHPPTSVLPRLSQVFGLSADELLSGNGKREAPPDPIGTRLRRKLHQIERMRLRDKLQIVRVLDSFTERGRPRKQG